MSSRHLAIAITALVTVSSVASAQAKVAPKSMGGSAAAPVTYIVAPTGNEARYRVREQLAGVDLPSDAIGATKEVTGQIVVDANGTVNKQSSKVTIGLKSLKSDKSRRDNYLRTHSLETDKFPSVDFVPTAFQGLTAKPTATAADFDVIGNLTVHGTTHPTTWKVNAKADGNDIVGTAKTAFTFKDMGMDQPKVPIVLSVEDTIKLEYDFRFTPKP
jgi:polyisoprenoid-binding protein YceI